MKIFRFSLIFLCFVLLCGCAKKEVTPIINGICFEADIEYYNEQYLCDATIDENGKIILSFKAPDTIEGLELTVFNGSISAKYMGLTYSPKGDNIPLKNIANVISCVYNDVQSKRLKVSGENIVLKDKTKVGEYVMHFSPSGFPLLLKVDKLGLTIQFYSLKNIT